MEPLKIEVELKVDDRLIEALNGLALALVSSPKAKSAPKKTKESEAAVEPRAGIQTRQEAPVMAIPTDEAPSAVQPAEPKAGEEEWHPDLAEVKAEIAAVRLQAGGKSIEDEFLKLVNGLGVSKLSDLDEEGRKKFILALRELSSSLGSF